MAEKKDRDDDDDPGPGTMFAEALIGKIDKASKAKQTQGAGMEPIGKTSSIQIGFVIVLIGVFVYAERRLSHLEATLATTTNSVSELKDAIKSNITKEDVKLIVTGSIDHALLEVYKEVNELKGRINSIERDR